MFEETLNLPSPPLLPSFPSLTPLHTFSEVFSQEQEGYHRESRHLGIRHPWPGVNAGVVQVTRG